METVDLSAGPVQYAESGEGPPVVLLHGVLMDHTVWDSCLEHLPPGFRYLRPVLPLGAHRLPMREGADLSLRGQARLVAEFLAALDLSEVTLVHSDWGGAIFLTALGLDDRVGRQVFLPCEAFDNFPPGLPGRLVVLAARTPGGISLACRQLRIGWLRRSPLVFGRMALRPVDDSLVRRWTEPALGSADIRRDLIAYATAPLDKQALVRDTEALRHFRGEALVLWSPANTLMPPEHGRRLAGLLARGRYEEVPGAYVLSMLDEPRLVGEAIGTFLTDR